MKKVFAFITALAVMAGSAVAQQFATVDLQRVSQSFWKVQAEQRSLADEQQRFADLQQQVQGRIDQLTKDMTAAQEDAQNPGLSDERKAEAQKLADSKKQEIAQQGQSFQMQYQRVQQRFQAQQAAIEAELIVSVKKIAKKNNLDVVFYANVTPYAKIDITQEVIDDLNSTQPADEAPVAPAVQ